MDKKIINVGVSMPKDWPIPKFVGQKLVVGRKLEFCANEELIWKFSEDYRNEDNDFRKQITVQVIL